MIRLSISQMPCIRNTRQSPPLVGQERLKSSDQDHCWAEARQHHGAICLENFDTPFVEPVTVDGNSAGGEITP